MELKEFIGIIAMFIAIIGFIIFTVTSIIECSRANKYWKRLEAEIKVYSVALKREHDILKAVQAYGEWLDTFHALMHTNVKMEDNEFNNGTLTAAGDCLGEFLNIMGEFVDGEKSSD